MQEVTLVKPKENPAVPVLAILATVFLVPYFIMLLLGAVHSYDVTAFVPALGYWHVVLINLLLRLVGGYVRSGGIRSLFKDA